MKNNLLPIGTVIELEDGSKAIILKYEYIELHSFKCDKFTYIIASYPISFITDFIPYDKEKEFEEKYKFNIDMNYSSDMQLDLNANYKRIIHEGYKNKDFYEMQEFLSKSRK